MVYMDNALVYHRDSRGSTESESLTAFDRMNGIFAPW